MMRTWPSSPTLLTVRERERVPGFLWRRRSLRCALFWPLGQRRKKRSGCSLSSTTKPVAIIPARGGSKRLPGKNINSFFGHPMMAYGVSAAVNSGLFEKVIVSTDDSEIGRVAEWYGAEFVERPGKLASDTAKSIDAVIHVLQTLKQRGHEPAYLCQIFPNCPLVVAADVVSHGKLFCEHHRVFQISVVTYRCVYPEWAMMADAEGRGRWAMGKEFLGRSQDCARTFCPTGA